MNWFGSDKLRRRVIRSVMVLVVMGATTLWAAATPVSAHAPGHCGHYSYYNGSWSTIYSRHFDSGSNHYNVYKHYYNDFFQHDEYVLCG